MGLLGNPNLGLRCFSESCICVTQLARRWGGSHGLDAFIFGTQFTLAWMLHLLEQCMAFVLN